MKIESNIIGVMDRMKRRQRAAPAAVQRVLADAAWLDDAERVAADVLWKIAAPNEMIHVPKFLKTIAALSHVSPQGFRLGMRNPLPPPQSLGNLQAARGAMGPTAPFEDLFRAQVAQFEDLVTQWVEDVKDKTKVDAGKSPRDIAEFITYALLHPGGADLIVRSGKNAGRTVREVFTPHLAAYLAQQVALPAQRIALWLQLVLAAWRELVHAQLGPRWRIAFRQLQTEL